MKKVHQQAAGFVAVTSAAILAFLWSPSDTAHWLQSPLTAADVSTAVMGAGPDASDLLRAVIDDPLEKAKASAPVEELPAQF